MFDLYKTPAYNYKQILLKAHTNKLTSRKRGN